jgi:transcriptional regulator with XRE-family HTH domain
MSDSAKTTGERLREARVAAGYKTAAEFAAKHGIPQPTYANHENDGRGIKIAVANKYAKALGNIDAAWLLHGVGKSPAGKATGSVSISQSFGHGSQAARSASSAHAEVLEAGIPRPRAIRVVARVQAGTWRESPELPGDERYDVFVPIDPVYSNLQLTGGEVRGRSMDLVYPEGTVLIFANAIDLGDGWMPEPGDRVLARRVSKEGLHHPARLPSPLNGCPSPAAISAGAKSFPSTSTRASIRPPYLSQAKSSSCSLP